MTAPISHEVPAYTVKELTPKTHAHAVIVPVINEGEKIRRQLRAMKDANLPCDIIIADGGSTDRSLDDEILRETGVSALLTKTGPGKLSAQLRMGFDFGLMRGYDGFVTIDGNGKDGVDAIPQFVSALKDGYGFVQGSRSLPGGEAVNTPLDRELAVRFIHAPILSLAAGFRYTDTTNGFRAFSAEFLKDPRVQPFRDIFSTYNLHYYLSLKAPRLGYKVKEIPVRRAYPPTGKTPTKIGGFSGRVHILRQLFETVLGVYDPKP